MKPIIRTSDRGQFKRCRQLWDFQSKIRMNYEYTPGIDPLDFGTAFHAAMEVMYDPKRWHDPADLVLAEGIAAFKNHMRSWRQRMVDTGQFELRRDTFEELYELGPAMLQHYADWRKYYDIEWEPVYAEIEFEVPIPVPYGCGLPRNFDMVTIPGYEGLYLAVEVNTYGDLEPVYYQGRIDFIAKNKKTGKLVIVDWKTAAQFWNDTTHLELDPQMRSYVWACRRMLGIDVEGVVYAEMRKAVPKPPALTYKGTRLSKNKQQDTTYELYKKAIEENGFNEADYADMLDYLQNEAKLYFRRIPVNYSDAELETTERQILDEAIDMLNDPRIYPNPSRWNCTGCQFRTPCLMRQDQSDWQWHLDKSGMYNKRI